MQTRVFGKGMNKRLLSIVLTLVMVAILLPFSSMGVMAAENATPESGTFTYNSSAGWSFNPATGELKITGTGNTTHQGGLEFDGGGMGPSIYFNSPFVNHLDIKSVVVGAGITELSRDCFSGCSNLTSVTFEEGSKLAVIGDSAFYNTGIESITVPDSVTSISQASFHSCTLLKTVDFGEKTSLKSIGSNAFYNTGITSFTMPDSVTSMKSAFGSCKALTHVTLSSKITTIPQLAFRECTALAEIDIPDSVTVIERSAFSECTNLERVKLPAKLTKLEEYAFYNCKSLTNVIFPATVTSIEGNLTSYDNDRGAFYGDTNLKAIKFKGSKAPSITSIAFSASPVKHVIVPSGADYSSLIANLPDASATESGKNIIGFMRNGGSGTMDCVVVDAGAAYELPETAAFTAPNGKTFDGWALTSNGEKITSETIEANDDITLYALWKSSNAHDWTFSAESDKIKAACDGSSCGSEHDITLTILAAALTYTDSAITKEELFGGMDFEDFNQATDLDLSADDIQIYAESDTNKTTPLNEITANGWYTAELTVGTDETAALEFSVGACTVTFDANGHGTAPDAINAISGETIEEPAAPAESGYKFGGWFKDAECTNVWNFDTDKVIGDTTLYAKWTQNSNGGSSGSSGSSTPAYTITLPDADQIENGTVTLSQDNAAAGSKVVITAEPKEGYVLDALSVIDSKGSEVKLTELGNDKFEFTMPAGKVRINAVFAPKPVEPEQKNFVDVASDAYYYEPVNWAVANGITTGTDDTHFSPDADTTRAQVVTFLWRAAGCPEPASAADFSDVASDSYYAKAVAWAVDKGITTGVGDNRFAPDAKCTRGQIVTFLYRYSGSGALNGKNNPFVDVVEDDYFYNAVLWAVENEVTSGTSATTFSPDVYCTRGQVVTFLYRYMGE